MKYGTKGFARVSDENKEEEKPILLRMVKSEKDQILAFVRTKGYPATPVGLKNYLMASSKPEKPKIEQQER